MKKTILLAFCFLSIIKLYSQVNIGQSRSAHNTYMVSLKKNQFDLVKNSTTYFIVPNELNYEEVQKNIEPIWTLNKIVFVQQDEYETNENDFVSTGNSVIRLIKSDGAIFTNFQSVSNNLERSKFNKLGLNFKFVMFYYIKVENDKKGEIKKDSLRVAEIYFTPSIKYRSSKYGTTKLLWRKKDTVFDKTKEPDSYNFNLGYIKNYFQTLSKKLSEQDNFKVSDGVKNKLKLKELNTQILYAPDWILKQFSATTRDFKKIVTAEELFDKYEHDYEVITNDELNSKILRNENFYYFMYTQFNDYKILSVIHSLTGEIIYLTEDKAFNVKSSDLKHISKLIK